MRFHGSGRIVQSVRVLCGFTLQLALVVESASTAVTKEPVNSQRTPINIPPSKFNAGRGVFRAANAPVVTYELDFVVVMASLDTVEADCVSFSRVTRPTPVTKTKTKSCKHLMYVRTLLLLPTNQPVEVVHGNTCIAGDFVEALAALHRLLDDVAVVL